jgi:hypothetical protein
MVLAVPPVLFGEAHGRAAVPAATPAAVRCAVTRLPAPAGMKAVSANAVDPTGTYIAGNNDLGPVDPDPSAKARLEMLRPVLWTNGRPQALPVLGISVRASAVNAAGVVVAVSGNKEWTSVLRYSAGHVERLATPAGDWVFQPNPKINGRGDIIVGASRRSRPDSNGVVFLWRAGAHLATPVPLPAGAEGMDLTDDRTIVGDTVGADGAELTSYAWNLTGDGRKLAVPAGQNAAVFAARGEWATGNLWPSGAAARWNLRTGALRVLDVHGPANAVNAHGWIVADGKVYGDDATVQLAPVGRTTGDPSAVSDHGLVVGSLLTGGKGGALVSSDALAWQCR